MADNHPQREDYGFDEREELRVDFTGIATRKVLSK
jgi:hypothetical protein